MEFKGNIFLVPAPCVRVLFLLCILFLFYVIHLEWGRNVLALAHLIYFSYAYVIHFGWGWLGGGLGYDVLSLAHLINILFLCLRHLRHAIVVGLVAGWIGVITSLLLHTYCMLRNDGFSCTSYTTPSYVKISPSWCYVTSTSLDFMLRNDGFSCTS